MRRTYEQVPEQPYSPFDMPKLPVNRKLALYTRQSQKDAPIKHKESYELQTVRLVEYARELGWKEEDIIVFIENKRKDGKWRKASGTLRIDQRQGLQSIVELIEADEIKAVMVWAVDRLFRHEDMIEPAVFVKICKEHDVIILTIDDFFDFNNPKREDRRRFLEFAQQAADYITKHVKGRMIPAKNQVSRRGDWDGRCLPIGLIIFEGEIKPHEFEPQGEKIRNLFKRFRELDGRLYPLWREIARKRDLFPPYPKDAVGVKGYMKEGPFGLSRQGLENMLTNPAYIGYWYHKEQGRSPIILKNNHPAIVDEEDFWYAFNLLSPTTITGEPNEQRKNKPPTRYNHVGTVSTPALLDGIIRSPLEKHGVYVFEKRGKSENAAYGISDHNYSAAEDESRAYIIVRELDRIFTQRLLYRLRMFQAMDAVQALAEPGKPREATVYQYLKQVQATITESNAGLKTQLEEYIKEAASLEKTLHYGAESLDGTTIKAFSKRLANLNATIEILSKKDDEAEKAEETLRDSAKLLTDASLAYDDFPFERKQKLVRLITTKICLSVFAPRWLLLEIEWSPFLGISVNDFAFIWRPRASGGSWLERENEILTSMYEAQDRDSIQKAFPNRSWGSILHQANRLGLSRPTNLGNNSPLHPMLSYEDQRVMQENGLEYDEVSELNKRVWWKAIPKQENSTSPRTYCRDQGRRLPPWVVAGTGHP